MATGGGTQIRGQETGTQQNRRGPPAGPRVKESETSNASRPPRAGVGLVAWEAQVWAKGELRLQIRE